MSHMMLELSTAHLSSRTLDALSENSIETVASYEKASRWLGLTTTRRPWQRFRSTTE